MGTENQKIKAGGKEGVTQEIRETLRNAKKYLQRGELKEISKEVGVNDATVTAVLDGKFLNWSVVEKIIERAERNKGLLDRAKAI